MMKKRFHQCRGSIYIITVLTCALVATIGAAALSLSRRQTQQAAVFADATVAESLLNSGAAIAMHWAASDAEWRKNYPNTIVGGVTTRCWETSQSLGDGSITLFAADKADGALIDFDSDAFELKIQATRGVASHTATVTLDPQVTPLPVLGYGLYSAGTLEVKSGRSLTGNGVPIRCGGNFLRSGTTHADVETKTQSGSGRVNGSITIASTSLTLPDTAALDRLIARATVLPKAGDIDMCLIAPGVNTYGGGLNAQGLYYIDSSGSDFRIKDSRILGTLIVNVGSSKNLTVDNDVLMETYRSDLPALIVVGNAEVKLRSATEVVSEASIKVNFNPAEAPYAGASDSDQLDNYPPGITGLVWVTGALAVSETPLIRGPVICGSVVVDGDLEVRPATGAKPPAPFYSITEHTIRQQSWARVP